MWSKEDIDSWIDVLAHVVDEAYSDPEIVRTAPHNQADPPARPRPPQRPGRWATTWRAYLRKRAAGPPPSRPDRALTVTESFPGLLDGRVALVTGAPAASVPRSPARFAAGGASAPSSTSSRAMPRGVDSLVADVTDEDDVERRRGCDVDRFGRLDVVVANAGVVPHGARPTSSTSMRSTGRWR